MYWWFQVTGLQAKTDQEAGVQLPDKNVAIKDQQDGNKDTREREVPHLRSSLSGGPAAPIGPLPPGRALQQQQKWRWARPTSSSSRFPQSSSQQLLSVSTLSPALPVGLVL